MILGLGTKSDEIQAFLRRASHIEEPVDSLDQASFVRLAASKRVQSDKALEAFELMDEDGKGVVVLEDLQRVAEDLGEEISREELVEMIALADRSGDGLLTPQDFVRVARKVNL
jgi:centrin-1